MGQLLNTFERQLSFFPYEEWEKKENALGGFLTAARLALAEARKPLSTADITKIAYSMGLLKSVGKTPQNSMRARLSEELRKNGTTSVFQRVGKNRFALREWKLPEYIAPKFDKQIPIENVVCYSSELDFFKNKTRNGIFKISNEIKSLLSSREGVTVQPRKVAEGSLNYKQLVSYIILRTKDDKLLTYMRGKYSSAHKTLLKGKFSLGFGGHVLDKDMYDLFSKDDCGVRSAAIREVNEELKGFIPDNCINIRSIFDSTSTEGYKHFGIVSECTLPDNFNHHVYRRELSINGVRLQTPQELFENFHLFEYWSQLIIKDLFWQYRPKSLSSIYPPSRPKDANTIILVGEIASGKTTILKSLLKSNRFHYVSARQCLIEILGVEDFKNKNRAEFQEKAQNLITSLHGPNLLATKIADNVVRSKITLIDGVRNISTIKELKTLLGDSIIVYVDCPRDKALENYKQRAGKYYKNIEFVNAREHATEQELPLILAEADAILYNAGSFSQTALIFSNWLNKIDNI